MIRRKSFLALIIGTTVALTACGSAAVSENTTDESAGVTNNSEKVSGTETAYAENTEVSDTSEIVTGLSKIDNTKWQYNEEDDVYYQLGIQYCENPADTDYEELAIIIPAAYMDATDNGDGTYTCTLNTTAEVNGYTAETAPIVFPVNTPGYAAQSPMTEYSSVSDYTDSGFIYVHAGCRGSRGQFVPHYSGEVRQGCCRDVYRRASGNLSFRQLPGQLRLRGTVLPLCL